MKSFSKERAHVLYLTALANNYLVCFLKKKLARIITIKYQSINGLFHASNYTATFQFHLLFCRSGLLESSGMTIKGVKSSSDPDLRATVPISSFGRISSVLVINVEEVIFLNIIYCKSDSILVIPQ